MVGKLDDYYGFGCLAVVFDNPRTSLVGKQRFLLNEKVGMITKHGVNGLWTD